MPPSPLTRLRKLCLALPDAHEVAAWGEPTFRVNNKLFAMYAHASNHHGAGHHAVWVKSTPVNQSLMIGANPKRFFSPPYVGPSGWVGVRLDGRVNWKELADILRDGYELTVTKRKARTSAAGSSSVPKTSRRIARRPQTR
jgi:predicted DNA-binding protein (MmcQ/YjbR family)